MYYDQPYGQQGGYYGQQGQPQIVRTVIGTEEMKEIIYILNKPPFNEQLSLVTFDELSQLDLLELLNKVLVHLDSEEHGGINIKDEYQQATSNRICHFLKILQYPVKQTPEFESGLVQGQKHVIHPILHYILTRLEEMEKKSKIWKFLVPLDIPEEHLNEEDMKQLNDTYKDFQAQYQVAHQNLEGVKMEMMQPNELKKELTQLEQEKEQLINKIRAFQQKNPPGKKDFQDLLEVTNLLRREQEEEARISEKIRQQKLYFEQNEQQQLQSQQRLVDAKRMVTDNSPEQMLYALRGEVKKNRELCGDRFQMEIMNKRKKLEQMEYLLNAPQVSMDDVINLENNLILLQNTIAQYEEKLRIECNPADDKLAIYKQQAQLVAKKKDKLLEELKTMEEEEHQLEQEIQKKEEMMQRVKGPGYKSKDDFKQYAANLRDKTAKFKKMKEELKELTTELTILQRTETILHSNQEATTNQLKKKEEAHGILGCMQAQNDIQEVSEKKQEIDQNKENLLVEISKIVTEIQAKMKTKKAKLTPQVAQYKQLEEKFNKVDMEYKTKKAQYEQITAGIESENSVLANDLKKIKTDVYAEDTKADLMKYKQQIIELKQKMLIDEGDYLNGKKQLNQQVKSYREYFQTKIAKQDQELKEMKQQRNVVKETHEPNQRQMQMFKDLDQFLQLKLQVLQNSNMGGGMQREEQMGNVNRLVLN